MNGLEEIQEYIKNFIFEKRNMQKQIAEIEEKRTQLANQRNEKKRLNNNNIEINELGKQISELGNISQELQNKLDSNFGEIKNKVNFSIDNLIAEGIRKIRKIDEEIEEIQQRRQNQEERKVKYELQKEEFYARFGRMPELSENAIKESKIQQKESETSQLKIDELERQINKIKEELSVLATTKRAVKNGDWNYIIEDDEDEIEIYIEPLNIEEMEPIEEIYVEALEPIEELYVEAFKPIEEVSIDLFEEKANEKITEEIAQETTVDEIEELAKAIVEEIVAEQTRQANINEIENIEEELAKDIITFEENEKKDAVIIPLFGQKATISNITVKIEDGELVYKAQMSDEKEIKIYPSKLGDENVLLRDKQNREECKEILINYSISEYKIFDKKVIAKIDPLICELLIECAEKYNYNAQELIYNYAMTFSGGNPELVPTIIYNLSYIEKSNLAKKEKAIINKICINARKNNCIDLIEPFSKFKKIKYILKRLFAVNNVKVLPEAKY